MDPKCILFSGPNSGAEKWPISQQPVATCGLSSGKQHGTNKKTSHEQRTTHRKHYEWPPQQSQAVRGSRRQS